MGGGGGKKCKTEFIFLGALWVLFLWKIGCTGEGEGGSYLNSHRHAWFSIKSGQ